MAQLFKNVKVWIQPGGYAKQAYDAMTPKLRESVYEFIQNGGGYVGFCAGAFLASPLIGSTGAPGLGIFPGNTFPYDAAPERDDLDFSIEKVTWQGKIRYVFFQGGPYLDDLDSSAEIMATYKDGAVAAARAPSGKGRVYISGPHPEAPLWWSEEDHVTDPDGSDQYLAVQMIHWVTRMR